MNKFKEIIEHRQYKARFIRPDSECIKNRLLHQQMILVIKKQKILEWVTEANYILVAPLPLSFKSSRRPAACPQDPEISLYAWIDGSRGQAAGRRIWGD